MANTYPTIEFTMDDDPRFHSHLRDYTDTMRLRLVKHMSHEVENSRPITRPILERGEYYTVIKRELFENVDGIRFESIELSCEKPFFDELVAENIRKEIARNKEDAKILLTKKVKKGIKK